MSDPMAIGQYQLENLLKNGVRFSFFDLSESIDNATARHSLLAKSERLVFSTAAERIAAMGLSKDAPIVLICENGRNSLEVARILGENSFLNVYVIEGGKASLT